MIPVEECADAGLVGRHASTTLHRAKNSEDPCLALVHLAILRTGYVHAIVIVGF